MHILSYWSFYCFIILGFFISVTPRAFSQTNGNAAFYTGVYRNLFLEAGYSQPERLLKKWRYTGPLPAKRRYLKTFRWM